MANLPYGVHVSSKTFMVSAADYETLRVSGQITPPGTTLIDPATNLLVGVVQGDGTVVGNLQAIQALVSKYGTSNGGLYLGAAAPKRTRRGTYGRRVATWSAALQNSAGTTGFDTADLPSVLDTVSRVLVLTQNATASFGQQNPVDGAAYLPFGATGSVKLNAGVWVKNPGNRTLNFELKFFNAAASRSIAWICAAEPGLGWQFLTVTGAQASGASFVIGTDAVAFVRVSQVDTAQEGAWLAGEQLKFGPVYAEPKGRARLLFSFDDGFSTVRNPINTFKVSGTAFVSSTSANVLTTNAAHSLVVGEPMVFTDTAPTGLALGTVYYVQTTPISTSFTLATDQYTLASTAVTTGFAGTANYQFGGSQQRSGQAVLEEYGFRGTVFLVPGWLNTTGIYGFLAGGAKFLTSAEVRALWADGWSVGSHSNTHPSNAESGGLRLLGPYGYYLSNPADNLPAQYLTNWALTGVRRRVTAGTQASPSVFATESAHQFLVNQPIMFTDVAPTGCTLGVTYYVRTTPSSTTYTLATDQGTLAAAVNNTTGAWSGTANYRHPGSAVDDSAIYADIMAGIAGVSALGIPTGATYFALPQGSADEYVRSACIRSGIKWIRGIGTGAFTLNVGTPTGPNQGQIKNPPGGWLSQSDALQTDGAATLASLYSYVDAVIGQGACGCNYHHDLSATNLVSVERLAAYAATKVAAGTLDVLTCDELGKELGIA